jgi:peptidoglycan-associated lipoprotein
MRSARLLLPAAALALATGLACKKPDEAPIAPPTTPTAPTTAPTPTPTAKPADTASTVTTVNVAEMQRAAALVLKDINFDFDRSEIREADKAKLQAIADFMRRYTTSRLLVEGHCDERGTVEYNLSLGERRATAAQRYLIGLGVSEGRLNTISYGKEKPKVQGSNEESWFVNRRGEFKLQ